MKFIATLDTWKPNKKNLSLLFFAALALRAVIFFCYVQHEERYKQPDANDYHIYATTITLNQSIPRYWRTPGYPLYLSFFYRLYGVHPESFSANSTAQKAAIWVQIVINACIPIVLFFLAYALTNSYAIAWVLAWIAVLHLGLILASMYLLTEGIALIFFYLFLFLFYTSFYAYGEQPPCKSSCQSLLNYRYGRLLFAALILGIFTWIRPMGQFVALVSACILLVCARDAFSIKLKKIILFLGLFFASIAPWYVRNYVRTGHLFFCPMFGIYLNSFTAPRILRDLTGEPLQKTWAQLQKQVAQAIQADIQSKGLTNITPNTPGLPIPELIAGTVSWPIILSHPWFACLEWGKEVCISMFDLYSYQLISFITNTFKWDPLEDFLSTRIAACLYAQPVPLLIRSFCWIEFMWSLFLWIGIFAGIWLFLIRTLIKNFQVSATDKTHGALFLKTGLLIGACMVMTGGFGYARLRLPIEPLLIILALTSWKELIAQRKT